MSAHREPEQPLLHEVLTVFLLDALDPESYAWQDEALCAQVDPELFFPEKGGTLLHAKRVCMACPVRAQCLDWAMEHNERFGIWGGMSEAARRVLRRQRERQAAA